jgi:fructokinase
MTTVPSPLFAAIEAGGTKFVCGIGTADQSIETIRIETRAPDCTIADVKRFFEEAQARHGPVAALGIASFGPLDLDPGSARYGAITNTSKAGWRDYALFNDLKRALGVPAAITTDVNAAALAEARRGAGMGFASVAYGTIGTGIGVGLATDGTLPMHGRHAEAGHLLLRKHADHAAFAGVCPYHGDCLEGLASGPAIIAAWGHSLDALPHDHPAWAVQADYIGQLCAALVLTVAPDVIVLGGGVMEQRRLFPAIRSRTAAVLGSYDDHWSDPDVLEASIVPSACEMAPGLVGAYLLAAQALQQ